MQRYEDWETSPDEVDQLRWERLSESSSARSEHTNPYGACEIRMCRTTDLHWRDEPHMGRTRDTVGGFSQPDPATDLEERLEMRCVPTNDRRTLHPRFCRNATTKSARKLELIDANAPNFRLTKVAILQIWLVSNGRPTRGCSWVFGRHVHPDSPRRWP